MERTMFVAERGLKSARVLVSAYEPNQSFSRFINVLEVIQDFFSRVQKARDYT